MSLGRLLLYTVLVLLVGIVWIVMTRSPEVTNYPTAGTNIIVFGDSIAFGVGTTKGNDFTSLLSERLSVPIMNMGEPGETTKSGLSRIDQVIQNDPRVVLVVLGGNDALSQTPPEETFQNLAAIIEKLQGVGAAILLVGEPGGLYGKRYPKGYESLAREYGVAYVPNILSGLIGRAQYMADTIHPNNAGHEKIADKIEPVLRDLTEHR